MKKSTWRELGELLNEAGLTISFDSYRDISKGCGPHCRAWAQSNSQSYCSNHQAAILRGDYLVPGGRIAEVFAKLKEEKYTLEQQLSKKKRLRKRSK